jgi:YD repeat-containing protein
MPNGKAERMTYRRSGEIATRTDFRGYTTQYVYDGRGHIKAKVPDVDLGELTVHYDYPTENMRVVRQGDRATTYTTTRIVAG